MNIRLFNSFKNGYNRTSGGRHCEQLKKVINKPYIMEDGTVICPQEYLDRPLSKEDKVNLCRLIRYNSTNGSIVGWTTIKKKLIENGYKIEDKIKTTKGKRESVSIITR